MANSAPSAGAAPPAPLPRLTVAIIGAGMSGICVGAQVLEKLPSATIALFDGEAEIGGTWHAAANYPGAACDVPSHLYSYSFAQNPSWSRFFSAAPEIKAYVKGVADRFGVTPCVRTSTRVTSAVWDEAACEWALEILHVPSGARSAMRSQFLVSAVGALYTPKLPEAIKGGLASFGGAWFHSARWDASVALAGKRVIVIGNGASAAQLVPKVADVAAELAVFQRTPSWVMPRCDYAVPSALRWLFAALPPLLWLYRAFLFATLELNYFILVEPTGLLGALRPVAVWLARRHLRATVRDPAIAERLAPTHEFGCKRTVLSNDFYEAFNRPHVRLVTAGVARVEREGVRDAEGTLHAADVIIFATGFDPAASLAAIDIRGSDGATFAGKVAADGGEGYLGITMHGFKNFFMCLGPNTGLGHTSIVFMIECQAQYIIQCMRRLRDGGLQVGGGGGGERDAAAAAGPSSLMVQKAAQDAFNGRVQGRLTTSIWTACASWYNKYGGKNVLMWPGTVSSYWLATRTVDWSHYTLGHRSAT